MATESSEISVLKSKSGGGGLIETLEGLRDFVARRNGLVVTIEKVDLRVSMAERMREIRRSSVSSLKNEIFLFVFQN